MAYKQELLADVFKWLTIAKKDLIENYTSMGLKAHGKYEKDLEIVETGNGGKILSAKHWGAMEYGRKKTEKKGDVRLLDIITEWVKVKGITPKYGTLKSMIFLITRKIHEKGIIVPRIPYNTGGVVSNVLTDDRIERLMETLKKTFIKQLK